MCNMRVRDEKEITHRVITVDDTGRVKCERPSGGFVWFLAWSPEGVR